MTFSIFPISDEGATIRVTNLSEDTRESDLKDLFNPFGSIQRIFLAMDRVTNTSKVTALIFSILISGSFGELL